MKLVYSLGLTYLALTGWMLFRSTRAGGHDGPVPVPSVSQWRGDAGAWFQQVRAHCNPVEVETHLTWYPPPSGWEGTGYAAACYGLAGNTARARELILTLEGNERWQAVGIVFDVGHPVADAGNDVAAGPIMELVVEFWPNHYMALYHAGVANHQLGHPDLARRYLEQFLEYYSVRDGFRSNATSILDELKSK